MPPSTTTPSPTPTLPQSFIKRKALILTQLSVPDREYEDLSPKGSIDEGIRHLIEDLNAQEGWVTTSSCAGRVCLFLEGERLQQRGEKGSYRFGAGAGAGDREQDEDLNEDMDKDGSRDRDMEVGRPRANAEHTPRPAGDDNARKPAGIGGKGGGGRWLFVSHDPVDIDQITAKGSVSSFLGMQRAEEEDLDSNLKPFTEERLVHFKFEPMILHILTATLSHAQTILKAALQAGFRESGALNLISASTTTSEPPLPMVAVRSTGLALDCIVGRLVAAEDDVGDSTAVTISLVTEGYLKGLLEIANRRFEENEKRIRRLYDLLLGSRSSEEAVEGERVVGKGAGTEWEDKAVRRERMRAEGLKRSWELKDRGDGDGF